MRAALLPPVEVKLGWPITAVAFMPRLNGGANNRFRIERACRHSRLTVNRDRNVGTSDCVEGRKEDLAHVKQGIATARLMSGRDA